ncbi:MAG: SurA N-terminal domain-containing protein [Blastocatellia bacterium]|nr:SurA N-terminal domain-containing protein [Blastocatellia bacterium]
MLRFFSKFQRSRTLLLYAFAGLLLVGLATFLIPGSQLDTAGRYARSTSDDDTVIAKVGSQKVTLKEFRNALIQMTQQFGRGADSIPLATLKQFGMDRQVLEQLISSRLVLDQAADFKLTGTDREVSDMVVGRFTDETGKFIGVEEYKNRLRSQNIDVGEFENSIRDSITSEKFRKYLDADIQVSDRDVEDKYRKDNTKVEVAYVTVDLDHIRKSYKPSEEDLKAYYDAHKGDFKAVAPVRKVEYIFISSDDMAKKVPVTEEELHKEYDTRKQKEYRASIIKLNVLAPQDETTVKNKIDELAAKVRGPEAGKAEAGKGEEGKGEDFATVARGNSQDPSAPKGGDIGWVKKDTKNDKKDWRQRIYTSGLKKGDIEGPFKEGKSWYLMKVTDERDEPFEDMRPTLKATLSNNKAFTEAQNLAKKAEKKAKEYKDLHKAAEEIAQELKVPVESLLKTTPYFKSGDSFELGKGSGRASNPAFEGAVSSLKKGDIGNNVSIPGGEAVPQVVDVIENGQQLTFEQARNEVEDKVRADKEPALAQAKAQEIVNKAANADDFQKIAKAEGLEVKTDTNFNGYNFPGSGRGGASQASAQAHNALATIKEGEVYKTPIKSGTTYVIFAATKRTEADLTKLPAQRESIRQSIAFDRQREAYDAYLKATRSAYEKEGKIKIYQDRIDKFFASTPSPQ